LEKTKSRTRNNSNLNFSTHLLLWRIYLSKKFVATTQDIGGERVADVLLMENLSLEELRPPGPILKAIGKLIAAAATRSPYNCFSMGRYKTIDSRLILDKCLILFQLVLFTSHVLPSLMLVVWLLRHRLQYFFCLHRVSWPSAQSDSMSA